MNESFLMIINYHLLTFTLFVIDVDSRFKMGYSYLAFIGLLAVTNISFVAYGSISRMIRKIKLRKLA